MLDAMKKSGWYGGAGHTEKDKRYINWRIGVIYDTNMRTAYAQAEYRDQLQGADLRPIWVYQSQLTGDNRRQEHIDLHGKAFRYDDRFWDTYYPPNGWGCECYVNTESEHGAEKAGIKVEGSKNLTLPEIDPTWKYNVGREALAPNFNKYTNLGVEAKKQIYENFHRVMNNTHLGRGELKMLLERTNQDDYKRNYINYQVGNLEKTRFEKLRRAGLTDSKIMATDARLWHGTSEKNDRQKIDEALFDDIYTVFQEPENIYEEKKKDKLYRTLHFVSDTQNGKKLKAVFYTKRLNNSATALQLTTMGHGKYEYTDKDKYEKIW
jgi:hypothetical protein